MTDNHTPLPQLEGEEEVSDVSPVSQKPISVQLGGRESEPLKQPQESQKILESTQEEERSSEEESDVQKSKTVGTTPKISDEAKKAGLSVAPSARQFPTIYDIKVPIFTDEQIESNLHKSFWTGAKWLAELGKYILWQSGIELKKIGKKVIRVKT